MVILRRAVPCYVIILFRVVFFNFVTPHRLVPS
jgi:hypothetical protein